MFDNIQEINSNKYLNHLEQMCKPYGVCGRLVKSVNPSDPSYNCYYFIMGLDKEAVNSPNIDIGKIYDRQRKDGFSFYTNIAAVKIRDCCPFAAHQDIIRYCIDVEFVKKIHEEFNKPVPQKISNNSLYYMKVAYLNTQKENLSREAKDAYHEMIEKCFEMEKEKSLYQPSKHRIEERGVLSQLFKRDNEKHDSAILEALAKESSYISHYSISAKNFAKFEAEIKKYPDVIYWCSEKNEKREDFKEDLFGTNGEKSTIQIAFNSLYNDEIGKAIAKLDYADLLEKPCDLRNATEQDLSSVKVNKNLLNIFIDDCKKNKLKCFADTENFFYGNTDFINIKYSCKDTKKMNSILKTHAYDTTYGSEKKLESPLSYERKNCIPLENVLQSSREIFCHTIRARDLARLKTILSKREDILYWNSKPENAYFNVKEGGVGNELVDNDLSTVQIVYDSKYIDDVSRIMMQIAYPEAFNITQSDIMDKGRGFSNVGIREYDFNSIKKAFEDYHVDYTIDENEFYYQGGDLINVIFSLQNEGAVDRILTALASDAEISHFYGLEQGDGYSHVGIPLDHEESNGDIMDIIEEMYESDPFEKDLDRENEAKAKEQSKPDYSDDPMERFIEAYERGEISIKKHNDNNEER